MKKNNILSLIVIFVLTIMLTGCTTKSESETDTKLPLGDVAYMVELDLYLKNQYVTVEATETESEKQVNYNYLKNNCNYTLSLSAKIADSFEDSDSKYIALSAGYYDEDNKFVEFKDSENNSFYQEVELTHDSKTISYNFTTPENIEDIAGDAVVKLYLGSNIDEKQFEDKNSTECTNYMKKNRACEIRITDATLSYDSESQNLLVETDDAGNNYYLENDSLYYYNTATIETVTSPSFVVTITLNSKTGVWQWFVEILGIALAWLVGICGGKYWLGLLIFTFAVRTLAWPIYAKTNSYSSNMAKIQPEMQKIQAKYEGRTDQNSQMKQQMEMRELMKKNHISVLGCFTPFLQMPIFLAVYQVVSRFPLTPIYENFDYSFFSTSFKMVYGQANPSWVLAVLVGLTMIGSQLLSMYFTKRAQKKHENFYTKQQNNKQQNKTTIIMMIVMTGMMVYFAFQNAGIAFYWVIGNLYQIGQTAISKAIEEKKEEKEARETGKVRGR